MSRMYIDYDPNAKIRHFTDTDADTGITTFGVEQDVTELIEANRQEYNSAPHRWGELTRVASMPRSVYEVLKREGIIDDPVAYRKWLNDPDNRAWRTRPGTV